MILDANDNRVENPDLDLGKIVQEQIDATLRYIIEVEKESHFEVIAEYPNGGKDVAEVIDTPEQGRWTLLVDGEEKDWDFDVPDDWPKESDINISYGLIRYMPYSKEELDEVEERKRSFEEARMLSKQREAILESLPGYQEESDAAICGLYEQSLSQQAIIEMQDEAICALYEAMMGGSDE